MKRWMLPLMLVLALPAPADAGVARADLPALWLSGQALEETTEVPPADRDMRISLWHDRDDNDPYRRGERLSVYFRTNQDLYAVVYRVDADGYVDVLWPTNRYSDGFVYGGHVYTLPPKGSPRGLRVSNSKGVEYVEAIASRYPFDLRALGIDFALDPQDPGEYRYAVAGDPFLAINDINFAITGLEEDVDYIVTDWVHLYVDSQVSHARYSCNQCHTSDQSYHPYVDTCSQVVIYRDFGWHTRWRASFGWYPLYCDPPYYYWDLTFYRPYVNWYYPVAYSWPGWRCYTRPYPVYWWHDSPRYAGNHVVRYRRGVTRSGPLWDVDRRGRGGTRIPASVRVADVRRAREGRDGRVDESLIVRGSPPARRADDRSRVADVRPSGSRGRTVDRLPPAGVRTGADRSRRDRGQVSLRPLDARTPGVPGGTPRVGTPRDPQDRGGRSWTRPVVRNADPQRDRGPVIRGGERTPTRPSTPEVRTQPRTSTRKPSTVQPRTQRTTPRKPPVVKPRTPSKPKPRATVKPRERKGGGGGGGAQVSRPAPRRSSPSVQRSAPRSTVKRSEPARPSVKRSAPSRTRPSVKRSAPAPSRPRPSVKRSAPSSSRSKPSVQRSRSSGSKGGGKATAKRSTRSSGSKSRSKKGGGGR